jgi:putative membrane protein
MKLKIRFNTLSRLSGGVTMSALLLAAVANAADTPATSQTTKGSGAARLSSNSEEAGDVDAMTQPADAKAFVRRAMEGNAAEIALAQVAERKTQNAELKQLAQMIRKDHEQANQQLQSLAQSHGVAVSTSTEKHQKKIDTMEKLSGSEFDQEYAKDMLKDHHKDIAMYERAAKNLKETDVQQYAQSTLAKLRQHLQHAQQAARAVGVDQATISSLSKPHDAMGGTADDTLERSTDSGKSDSKIKD